MKNPTEVFATLMPKSEHHRPEIVAAKREELIKWTKYEAFEVVEDQGQEKIDCT